MTPTRLFRNLTLWTLTLLSVPALLDAQTSSAILGTVYDPSSAAIANAKVEAKNLATGATSALTTDGAGRFRLPSLPPGSYEVTVEASGFAKYLQKNLTLELNQQAELEIRMQVATAAETVIVSTEAPLINTTSAEVGVNFDNKRITELPLAPNRNVLNVALQVAGVSQLSSGNSEFAAGGVSFSVNGMRTRSNNFTIDGADSNNASVGGLVQEINNPDTVAEFRLITNQFLPEYGRAAGSVVSIVTKGGTNDFHGSAYWFYNSNAFNSRTNLDERTFSKAPWRNEHQTAGTLGGPVIKNRTFLFGSFLRWTDRRFASGTAITGAPTEAGRQILAGLNTQQTPRPQIAALLNNLPAAQTGTGTTDLILDGRTIPIPTGTLSGAAANTFLAKQWSLRADHRINDKHQAMFRMIKDDRESVSGQAVPAGLTSVVPSARQAYTGQVTSSFRPTMINELRLNYQRFRSQSNASDPKAITIPSIEILDMGLQGFNASIARTAIGLAVNLPQSQITNNYQLANNFSLIRGSHAMKFGIDFRRQEQFQDFNPTLRGRLTYPTLTNFVNDQAQVASINVLQSGLPRFQSYRYYDYFWFWQDEWRVRPGFTLTYGIRYESPGNAFAWLEQVGRTVLANNNNNPGFATDEFPGRDTNNWAPRVGFNWKLPKMGFVTGDGKLVFRGGYSRTYDLIFNNIALNIYSAWPFTQVYDVPLSGALRNNAFRTIDPIRAGTSRPPVPANPLLVTRTIVGSDFRAPHAEQFAANFQREIGRWALTGGWIGTKGTGLFQTIDGNPIVPGSNGTLRVDPNRGTIRLRANAASSIYHSLQTSVEKRFSSNYSVAAHYTWSAFIDDASEIFNPSVAGEIAVSQDSFNRRADRSRSTYDRPHRFTVNGLYETPWFKDQRGVGRLLGGWNIGGFLTFQSGPPFSPLSPNDPGNRLAGINALVGNAIRPNVATNLDISSMSINELFAVRTTLFSPVTAASPIGNAGRNILRAKGIQNVDFVVNKRVRMPFENHNLNFRFEFYNLTNTRNFGIPNANFTANAFLRQWDTDGGGRRIVMGLRYAF